MRSIFTKALLVAAVMTVGGATSRASAQALLEATIPFAFTASGTTHAAGTYAFRTSDDEQVLEFSGPAKTAGFVPVLTRLAAPATPLRDGRLVFDKVGDTYTLSELWLPAQDGFLIHVATDRHTHHVVTLHKHARRSS